MCPVQSICFIGRLVQSPTDKLIHGLHWKGALQMLESTTRNNMYHSSTSVTSICSRLSCRNEFYPECVVMPKRADVLLESGVHEPQVHEYYLQDSSFHQRRNLPQHYFSPPLSFSLGNCKHSNKSPQQYPDDANCHDYLEGISFHSNNHMGKSFNKSLKQYAHDTNCHDLTTVYSTLLR